MILRRPLLAAKFEPGKINYPVYVSVKIDGIRCLIDRGVAYSRKLKPIPNGFVQEWAQEHKELHGADGELGVGPMNAPDFFRVTTSGVMSQAGEPDFTFYAFDMWNLDSVYKSRLLHVYDLDNVPRVSVVDQLKVDSDDQVLTLLTGYEEQGHEGLMLRAHLSRYKQGRATLRSQELVKVKSYVDEEATVIGFEEEMQNLNEAVENELGFKKRSSHKENKKGKGTLGALTCRREDGVEFSVGSGYTAQMRADLWKKRSKLIGKEVKYRYFPVGVKEKPRHPVFLGFRED